MAIAFWLGCSVFAVVTAQNLFSQGLDGPIGGLNRELAGAIAGTMFRDVYRITYICIGVAALFLLITSFGEAKGSKGPKRALILCFLVLGLNAVSDLYILEKVHKIKLAMVNPDGARTATLKQEFDKWHTASTAVYGTAVIFGVLAAAFLLPTATGGKAPAKSKPKK